MFRNKHSIPSIIAFSLLLALAGCFDPGPVDLLDGVEPNQDIVGDTIGVFAGMELGPQHLYNSVFIDGREVPITGEHPVNITIEFVKHTYHVFFVQVPDLPPGVPYDVQAIVREQPGGPPVCCSPALGAFTVLSAGTPLNINDAQDDGLWMVNIWGNGFDALPGQNTVYMNVPEYAATVDIAQPTFLHALLSEEPKCGVVDLSVSVAGKGEASHVFPMGIYLKGSYPDRGQPGDQIVLRGSYFSSDPERNTVRFRSLDAAPANEGNDPYSWTSSESSGGLQPLGPTSGNTVYNELSYDPFGESYKPNLEDPSLPVDTSPEMVWSTGMVMEVKVPNCLSTGASSITVIVDGVSSNPISFYVLRPESHHITPVDVEPNHVEAYSDGAHSLGHSRP